MHETDQVTVTGTGYFGAARQHVRQLTRQLGARYSGDLIHGVTTQLVCQDKLVSVNEKVRVASAWGIPIVQHAWLVDSVEKGSFLPIDEYCLIASTLKADTVLSATVTARPRSYQSAHGSNSLSYPSQSESDVSRMGETEVLRCADAPTNCQLADLLLATALSPHTGI